MLSLGAFATQLFSCIGIAISITKKALVSVLPRWTSVVLRHGARVFGPGHGRIADIVSSDGGLDSKLRTVCMSGAHIFYGMRNSLFN